MEQQKVKASKKRYFAYDLMRAIAMLLIVFYHMNCEWSARQMDSLLVVTKIGAQGYLGWQGVSLFILVSGAAQCISYERCSNLKTYYKKRWWSIFPSFYLAYFVCYLMGGFGGGVKLFDPSFLWTLTGLDGYVSLFGIQSHYLVGEWFIGMILVLYIVFPVLYALVTHYPKQTLIVALLYYLVMVQLLGKTGRVDKDILLNVVMFLAGIYLYHYVKNVSLRTGVVAAVLLCLVVFIPLPERVTWYLFALEGILWYLIFMAAGNALDRMTNMACMILKKLVGVLSKYSYEIFLLHHVLISVSLSPYEQSTSYSVGAYLLWALRALVVIGLAAWMIYPRWKPQIPNVQATKLQTKKSQTMNE